MSFPGIKVSIFILCAFCVWRRIKGWWTLAASVQGERMLASSQQDASSGLVCSSALKTSNSRCLIANIFRQYLMAERLQVVPTVTTESGSLTPLFIPPLVPLSPLLLLWHRPPVCLSSETWKWILLFQTQLMMYLPASAEPRLKISIKSLTCKSVKVVSLQNLHVLAS